MPRSLRVRGREEGDAGDRRALLLLPVLYALYFALALWIVRPALEGSFLSDDHTYIVSNPYIHELSLANLGAILDPWGPAAALTMNYAPAHLFAHAVEWRVFGPENMLAWHLVNVAVHALASLLLVALFARSRIPLPAAIFGGTLFLIHPANVETVVWIFQLKTILALALSLGALLLHPQRPRWAALLFALALLTKITALVALPVAMALAWVRGGREPARWGWLAVWGVVALAIAIPEIAAFGVTEDPRLAIPGGPLVQLRTIFSIAMRYLLLAVSGTGLSTFHEPSPANSGLDPWWLGGLAVFVAVGWRTVKTLRRRREESAYWIFAAISFVPVSQIFPFLFPMGDRYLYPILPGLIGAVMLAAQPAFERAAERVGRPVATRTAGIIGIAVLALFAIRAEQRAPVYLTDQTMMIDAALHYPEGMVAHLLRAQQAAREGNARRAAHSMAIVVEGGFGDLFSLLRDSNFSRVRRDPEFRQVLQRLARIDVEKLTARSNLQPFHRVQLALAHSELGEPRRAMAALEPALDAGGPFDEVARTLFEIVEREARALDTGPPATRGHK